MKLTLVLAILATCSKFSHGAIYILRIDYTNPDDTKQMSVEMRVTPGQNLKTGKKLLVITENLQTYENKYLKNTLPILKGSLKGYVRPVLEIYKPWLILKGLSKMKKYDKEFCYDTIEGEKDQGLYHFQQTLLVDQKKDFWIAVHPLREKDSKPYIWLQRVQDSTNTGFSAMNSWKRSWSFNLVQSLWPEHVWKKSEIRGEKITYGQFCGFTTKPEDYALFIWTGIPKDVTNSIFEGENWVRMHVVNKLQLECYGVHFDVNIGAKKVRIKFRRNSFLWKGGNRSWDGMVDETNKVISILKSEAANVIGKYDFAGKFRKDVVTMKYFYVRKHAFDGGYRNVTIDAVWEENEYVKAAYSGW